MTTTAFSEFPPRAALAAIVSIGIGAALLLSGGMSPLAIASAALFIAPVVLYAVLRWPLESIFGLYVLLVPFDNVLNTGSVGTVTKLLGMAAGGFLLIFVVRRGLVTLAAPPVRILCALLLWMLATTLWAIDQTAALQMMVTLGGLMLLYGVVTMIPISPAQYRGLLMLVVVGGVCAAAYGANTFYHDPTYSQESLVMRRLIVQVGNYQIDPNHFCDALIFPAAILVVWYLRSRNLLTAIASVGGLGIIVTAILLSGSREGLSSLFLIAAYYLWRSRYRIKLLIAISAIVALAATVQTSVFLRFSSAWQTGGSGRTSIWAVALEAAKHRLLQGYGIGNITQAYNMFYLTTHQTYYYGWYGPAHNLVLHYLVEIGLVGLGLIAAFFWAQFRSLREIGPDSEYYDYRILSEAALLAIMLVSMAIDLFQYKYAWLVFTMVALTRNVAVGRQQSAAILPTSSVMMSERSASVRNRDLPVSPSLRSALLSSSDN
jgi:O-antigen ligase